MSALDRLSLVQWLSPSFPTGGFAYSHGLEQAMVDGAHDVKAVVDWVGHVLCLGGGWTDAVLLSLVLRGQNAAELAETARALAGSAERVTETMDQGSAFARTVAAMTGKDIPPCPLPIAVGIAARELTLPHEDIIAHYLHAFAANLISAATRFLPLGQTQAQSALSTLHPTIIQIATRAAMADLDALGTACLGADLAAMRHETLDVRIFRT